MREQGMTQEQYYQLVYNFRVKRTLPMYDLERPPGPFDGESGAVVIFPLFRAYEGIVPHYIINSAFWASHAWRVNTDALAKEWDILFYVEDEMYEIPEVRQQFESANLTDFVVTFSMPSQGHVVRHKLGFKMYAMVDEVFSNYRRAYLWDTDNFLSRSPGEAPLDTDRLLNIGDDETLVNPLILNGPHPDGRGVWREKYDKEMSDDDAEALWLSVLEGYLGDKTPAYYSVSGQLMAWNPQELRQDFKDMVIQLTPDVADDEDQYGFYVTKTGLRPQWDLNQLWHIPMYFSREDYFKNAPHYFDHVWLKRGDEDDHEWFTFSSLREVHGISAYDEPEIHDIWTENIGLRRRL